MLIGWRPNAPPPSHGDTLRGSLLHSAFPLTLYSEETVLRWGTSSPTSFLVGNYVLRRDERLCCVLITKSQCFSHQNATDCPGKLTHHGFSSSFYDSQVLWHTRHASAEPATVRRDNESSSPSSWFSWHHHSFRCHVLDFQLNSKSVQMWYFTSPNLIWT